MALEAERENYLREVRAQYENYPYPFRDPEAERTQFTYEQLSALPCLNHYQYGGRRDFTKGFRALVAGGGTGDATLMLAEQCRDMQAEIVYLDISDASMAVAKQRAAVRGLENIRWVHGSLLDARKLLEGEFDFIHCSGVLHHLASPAAGLAALARLLKDDGTLAIMLYAQYGRESIYQIQKLMRLLNSGDDDMQQNVERCKAVLRLLPSTHRFTALAPLIADLSNDIGIYDLFLHSHDVAYTIPQIYAFLRGAGLEPGHFFFGGETRGNDTYRLESYIAGELLTEPASRLSREENQAAAELMHGNMLKHMFYASRRPGMEANAQDMEMVPFLSPKMQKEAYGQLVQLAGRFAVGEVFSCQAFEMEAKLVRTPNLDRLLAAMDGEKSTGDILKAARLSYPASAKRPGIETLKQEFVQFYHAMRRLDWIFLRAGDVPAGKTIFELHAQSQGA